jgi:hypothetical protein
VGVGLGGGQGEGLSPQQLQSSNDTDRCWPSRMVMV